MTAKTIEIRDNGLVNCTGVAQTYQALLTTLQQLQASPGVRAVKIDMVHGKSPMQFTFEFQYNNNGGANED